MDPAGRSIIRIGSPTAKLRIPTALRILWSRSSHSGLPIQSRQTSRSMQSSHPGPSRRPGRPSVNFQSTNPSILAGLVGLVSLVSATQRADPYCSGVGAEMPAPSCGFAPPVLRGPPLGVARMTKGGSVWTHPKRPAGRPAVGPLSTVGILGALLKHG